MTSGEWAGVVSIICLGLSSLGFTGVDTSVVSGAMNGIIAIVGLISALYTAYKHRQAVIAAVVL